MQASRFPLPSVASRATVQPPASKRRRIAPARKKTHSKTVICLPPRKTNADSIAIPRGESLAALQEAGLVGKVSIDSTWNADDIRREITTLFGTSFGVLKEELLPYEYLT